MNPVTRQELTTQLQQTANFIITRTATHDELLNMMQNISQRFCTKQDLQCCIEANREKLLERLAVPVNEQQAALRQIFAQFELFAKAFAQLEVRIDALQQAIKTGVASNSSEQQQPNSRRTVLEQFYAR